MTPRRTDTAEFIRRVTGFLAASLDRAGSRYLSENWGGTSAADAAAVLADAFLARARSGSPPGCPLNPADELAVLDRVVEFHLSLHRAVSPDAFKRLLRRTAADADFADDV